MHAAQALRLDEFKYSRRRLLHIVATNAIDSMSVFALDIIKHMPEYQHTVWHVGDMAGMEYTWMQGVQATGAELLQYDGCAPQDSRATAVIAYDTPGLMGYRPAGVTPVLYYRYRYAAPDGVSATLCVDRSHGIYMPPAICSRAFDRRRSLAKHPFTIGIFSAGHPDKYPGHLIEYFKAHVPDDVKLIYSSTEKAPANLRKNVWALPVMLDAPMKGLLMSDMAIYGHAYGYTTPFGRLCAEMLSSGVPVICERRGAPAEMLKDKVHTLFYDTPEEALKLAMHLRSNPKEGAVMAANARLWASWYDITIHLGTLKGLLRAVGA